MNLHPGLLTLQPHHQILALPLNQRSMSAPYLRQMRSLAQAPQLILPTLGLSRRSRFPRLSRRRYLAPRLFLTLPQSRQPNRHPCPRAGRGLFLTRFPPPPLPFLGRAGEGSLPSLMKTMTSSLGPWLGTGIQLPRVVLTPRLPGRGPRPAPSLTQGRGSR